MADLSSGLITKLRDLPVQNIAAINGPAAGAGVGLAPATGFVIGTNRAYFYLPLVPRSGMGPDLE